VLPEGNSGFRRLLIPQQLTKCPLLQIDSQKQDDAAGDIFNAK